MEARYIKIENTLIHLDHVQQIMIEDEKIVFVLGAGTPPFEVFCESLGAKQFDNLKYYLNTFVQAEF